MYYTEKTIINDVLKYVEEGKSHNYSSHILEMDLKKILDNYKSLIENRVRSEVEMDFRNRGMM